MTMDEVRAALAHFTELDADTQVDLEAALHHLHPRYRQLLVFRAAGYSKREAMRMVGTRGGDDMRRAERALMRELNACDDE